MGICPECHSRKPALAPRCYNCNTELGYSRSLFATFVHWGAVLFFIWLLGLFF